MLGDQDPPLLILMSSLTEVEKRHFEKALRMSSGYVGDFSNSKFRDFILDTVEIDIYDSKYDYASGSKANRLRAFWSSEDDHTVAKLMDAFFTEWEIVNEYNPQPAPPQRCWEIVQRLKSANPHSIPVEVLDPLSDDKAFYGLASSVKRALKQNHHADALDRLHTYTTRLLRQACTKHSIGTDREKPLHSLMGEYVKVLVSKGHLQSDMSARILKTSISLLEAYNAVRNDHSYAHDNPVLGTHESELIVGNILHLIHFIRGIEN